MCIRCMDRFRSLAMQLFPVCEELFTRRRPEPTAVLEEIRSCAE